MEKRRRQGGGKEREGKILHQKKRERLRQYNERRRGKRREINVDYEEGENRKGYKKKMEKKGNKRG